jgi:cysteinyl-tRNA synthetase
MKLHSFKRLKQRDIRTSGDEGVYFDTSTFKDYGKLGDIDLSGLRAGARVENDEKKHPTDFLLWKSDAKLGWNSPWGLGFPGWHIECSAMIRATLGEQIDIHTGGIDLMPTHHNNEIAQSEAASGKKPFSRFWLHHEFLNINAEKISKSVGNMINLSDVTEKGIQPLAYRYFLLGAHYKTPINFTWEALEAAQNALLKLYEIYGTLEMHAEGGSGAVYKERFEERINDDLDTPGALAVLWEMTRDESVAPVEKIALAEAFDAVLGLNILFKQEPLPEHIVQLKDDREHARLAKNWQRADEIRDKIEAEGYEVKDTASGTVIYRQPQS